MKFTATVVGAPQVPLKRGEAHVTVAAATRLLAAHTRYVVAFRRVDVTRQHSHHLRLVDGIWTLTTVSSPSWPRNPEAEREEHAELATVLTNLGFPITQGAP